MYIAIHVVSFRIKEKQLTTHDSTRSTHRRHSHIDHIRFLSNVADTNDHIETKLVHLVGRCEVFVFKEMQIYLDNKRATFIDIVRCMISIDTRTLM
jgi:hypothetical protein